MINLAIGIAIGAAFSKFWIAVYEFGKTKVVAYLNKDKATDSQDPK